MGEPILSERELRLLTGGRRGRPRQPVPNILAHPDGRLQISSEAIQKLWPTSPHGEDSYPRQVYVRVYARGSDELVIAPADPGDPDALVASPVGRREIRWPVVYVVRAARFMRELGIYGLVRYEVRRVSLQLPDGRVVPAVLADLRRPVEGRRDDIAECLREWRAHAEPGVAVGRNEFLKQLAEVARRLGTVITRRQLEDYVRSHKSQIAQRLGIRFVLSGKTTFREVVVEPQPQAQTPAAPPGGSGEAGSPSSG